MTVPVTGPVSVGSVMTEFGATKSLSQMYRNGGFVPTNQFNMNVPTSGGISLGAMRGARLYTPGSMAYTVPGTYTFTVPAGVTTIYDIVLVGGGGGAGGNTGGGDNHAGGGGGSGGLVQGGAIAVVAGQQLTIAVGEGGKKGAVSFNGGAVCAGTSGGYAGGPGGTSSLAKEGTPLYTVTGGGGGWYNTNDNNDAYSGAGGSPSGVPGGAIDSNRNNYSATSGGVNALAIGSGGHSHATIGSGICTSEGDPGQVKFKW